MFRFGAAVFVSAALLFMVQPMAAKRALPALGGSPGVWTASLLFFQAALLAGYGYAHLLSSRLSPRRQVIVHALTLLLPFAALAAPLRLEPPAPDAAPVPWLLLHLGASVGLPFFALSTTASLLQRWFSLGDPRDPAPLYAASNLGSLAGLFAYPFLVEPLLPLDRQRPLWAAGYALFVLLAAACAVRAWRSAPISAATAPRRTSWGERLRWIALAAGPSSLLLGATQHLSTDLTPFPLLWVLPLALYLLSYVAAFSRRPWLSSRSALRLETAALLPLALLLPWEIEVAPLLLPLFVPLHLAALFFVGLACHGELAARRPPPEGLTEFYFCSALGGALGGLFNALLAPALFRTPIEYPLLLVAVCFLRPRPEPKPWTAWRATSFPLALLLMGGTTLALKLMREKDVAPGLFALAAAAAAVALLPLLDGRPARLAAGVAALLLLGAAGTERPVEVLHRDRSFFGAHHVERSLTRRSLVHGRILHGAQDDAFPERPLTYYHRRGPCGRLFEAFGPRVPGGRVGAVGLGAGTIAAYGRPGQRWTFYEIDAAVERCARAHFSYLRDSAAAVEVVIADGRLGLSRAVPGEFGLIVLDAFSSDAVPTHLLTREALELYESRLAPGGLLAFHVSNRFFDLVKLLGAHAARAGWAGVVGDDQKREETGGGSGSTWVLLARRAIDLAAFANSEEFSPLSAAPGAPAWTDAHSPIFPYVRIR